MGVTWSGIRWPEPTEPVNQGAVAMRNLAEDVAGKYGRGLVGRTVQNAQLDVGPAGATVLSTVITLPAQRWVRVFANIQGNQITAASSASQIVIMCNGTTQTRFQGGPIAAGDTIFKAGEAYYLAPAGTFTGAVGITGLSAGALRLSASTSFLTILDVGAPGVV